MKKLEETVHSLDLKVKDRDLKNKGLQEKVISCCTISFDIYGIVHS